MEFLGMLNVDQLDFFFGFWGILSRSNVFFNVFVWDFGDV